LSALRLVLSTHITHTMSNIKKARSLWKELKDDGSPLSLKAADCIASFFPSKTKELDPIHKAIILIFQDSIRSNRRDSGEMTAWRKVKGTIDAKDVELLSWFYGLDKSEDCDHTWSRKNAPATLMNNIEAQLQFALNMKKAKATDRYAQFRT